ncbi:MAG: hypothetical protein HJJLKODD_00545 [Phycisphaerae bacterium]|nr:hypothetical protein [Phycisphaerae bacterium]
MKLGISGAIAKPIDPEILINKIMQTLLEQLRRRVNPTSTGSSATTPAISDDSPAPTGQGARSAAELENFLQSAQTLQALPFNVEEVKNLINSNESRLQELVEVVRQDPVLAASILRLANSDGTVTDQAQTLDEAISKLGFQRIGQIVNEQGVLDLEHTTQMPNFSILNYWKHSVAVSRLAQQFARTTQVIQPEQAALAGLLHGLSVIALVQLRPDLISDLQRAQSPDPLQFIEDQKAAMGWSVAQIAEMLISKWSLPEHLAQSIGHYQDTREGLSQLSGPIRDLAILLQAANIIVQASITDPFCQYPIYDSGLALEWLLERSHINQEYVNRELNAIIRKCDTLAMCNFPNRFEPPKPPAKALASVAYVRPDRMPASPLYVFLDRSAHRVTAARSMAEVASENWDALYIDGALGGQRFTDRALRDFNGRSDLHKRPAYCLVRRNELANLDGAYYHLPIKLHAPCWAKQMLPGT